MTVLVTGGSGYIGSHVLLELQARGYLALSLDRAQPRLELENVKYFLGDFADPQILKTILEAHEVEAVIHLAASIDAFESLSKPEEYFENNTHKTLLLAKFLLEHGVKNLVFASSAAVYGPQTDVPIKESAQLLPINPYGESKLLAEKGLLQLTQDSGLKVMALRFFNVCGSKEHSGIRSGNQTSLFAQLISAIKNNEEFSINGDDLKTADGTAVRDFVHVQDVARACVVAMESLANPAVNFEAFNVGSGHGYSIRQVISAFERQTGQEVKIVVKPRKSGDIPISVSSIDKISRELSFQPEFSELGYMVKTSWF